MADRLAESTEKISRNRKRRKNKVSKKKSKGNFSSKCAEKVNSQRAEKCDSVHEKNILSKDVSYNSSIFTSESNVNKQEKYTSSNDKIKRHSPFELSEHHQHDSSNFKFNRNHSRSFHDGADYNENNVRDKKFHNISGFANINFNDHTPDLVNSNSLHQQISHLTEEVNYLHQENMRLLHSLEEFNYDWNVHSDSDIEIVFKKKHLEEKYSVVLKKLISHLLAGNVKVEELNKFCSFSKYDGTQESPEPSDECLFKLDSSGGFSASSTPMYEASFVEILESPNNSKNASANKSASMGKGAKNCFNCGEDHHLQKCPHKLNFQKIAIARKQAKSNFIPSVRYHVHGKNESDYKPGIISNELREALGLQTNQIPPYVYRMRVLDYPPGWLHEAAVESSGMILYDSEGNALKEENCEDGEIDTTAIRVQHDPDKLIDYPGFNVPLPADMIEEGEDLGLPPLQPQQLRNFVEKYMAKPDLCPSRKRKINLSNSKPTKIQRVEEDMEIEDSDDIVIEFLPPLPEIDPPPPPPPLPPSPPPPPPPPDSSETSQDIVLSKFPTNVLEENSASLPDSAVDNSRVNSCSELSSGTSSPSLAELVDLRKQLVMQLGNNIDEEPSVSNPSQNDESSLLEAANEGGLFIVDECGGSDTSNLSNLSESNSALDKTYQSDSQDSFTRTTSQSKCVTLGTPSLSRHSPYAKLPEYDEFSKNVSAHIPFENLPNSTGTYEKMKNVLKKVKNKLNSFMK